MLGRITCPACKAGGCERCRVGFQSGMATSDNPKVPLPWFLEIKDARWPRVVDELRQLQEEADRQGRELRVFDIWHRSRTIVQLLEDDKGCQHPETETWTARQGLLWSNARNDLMAEFNFRDYTADRRAEAPPEPDSDVVEVDPDAELGVPSRAHAGLYILRRGTALVFTWKPTGYWEAWDARTGAKLGARDTGTFPDAVAAYIGQRLQEILPPSRRAGAVPEREETALTANQRAASSVNQDALVRAQAAPIVSAPEPAVNQKENEPMLDLSNPAVVDAARKVANNIKNAIGIPALEARRDELRKKNLELEKAYRLAEVDVEQAKRDLNAAATAIKDREAELLEEFSNAKDEADPKKKKYSVDGAKAAAAVARKTDEEYVGLKAAHATAEAALNAAEKKFAEAKAEQRVLVREHELLKEEYALASARINAFGGLDALPAAGPAPITVPTPNQPSAA